MVADGAGAIDVGGESTRPGARALAAEEEIARVMPVLERLHGRIRVPVAVDTYKAAVAERALERGAVIVNDVSALGQDPALAGVVARRGAAVVLMHSRGRSADMYAGARYGDVTGEIVRELSERVRAAEAAGIRRDRIIVDPGIGFAKTAAHSLRAIARLGDLHVLGCPVLSGPSRKSFLRAALGDVPPEARVWGTAAAVAASGDHDGSIAIRRAETNPDGSRAAAYRAEYKVVSLSAVAAKTRTMPPQFLKGTNDISPRFVEYARPLVGEMPRVGRI